MAYLGINYRLVYEAKNFRSGLTNILAVVLKPDGALVGPFTMVELNSYAGFTGVYAYEFVSDSMFDPEGEYVTAIVSPTDNIRDLMRFTLVQRPAGEGETQIFGASIVVTPQINQVNITISREEVIVQALEFQQNISVEESSPEISIINQSIEVTKSCD